MSQTPSYYFSSKVISLEIVPSYLFLEFLASVVEETPDVSMHLALQSAAKLTYGEDCKFDEEGLGVLAGILVEEENKKKALDSEGPSAAPKLGMGTQCIEWLSKLSPQELCTILAGFCPKKTETLYCATDYRLVAEMGKLYMESRWHQIQSQYEGAMYAFGGGYKGSEGSSNRDKGAVTAIDLTKDNPNAHSQLKKSGF